MDTGSVMTNQERLGPGAVGKEERGTLSSFQSRMAQAGD